MSLLALGIGAGCVESRNARVEGSIDFNATLREDFGPRTADDIRDKRALVNNGLGGGLIDILLPTNDAQLEKLRRSQSLWMVRFAVDLTYEVVAFDPRIEGRTLQRGTGMNQFKPTETDSQEIGYHPEYGLTDVPSRSFLYIDGGRIGQVPPANETDDNTVALRRCTDGPSAQDAYSPPGTLEQSCIWDRVDVELCDEIADARGLPQTALRCQIPVSADTSMLLMAAHNEPDYSHNRADGDPLLEHEPTPLLPDLKVVDPGQPRMLARPMSWSQDWCVIQEEGGDPNGRPCVDFGEDPGAGQKVLWASWTWQVGEDAETGWWDENFMPDLFVRGVRLFVEDASEKDGRRYLTVDEIAVLGVGDSTCTLPETDEADPDQPDVSELEFDLSDCQKGSLRVTPTYDHMQLQGVEVSERLLWTAHFGMLADGSGFLNEWPVKPGDPLYIEFEVASLDGQAGRRGLSVAPPVMDAGDVEAGKPVYVERAFRVVNYGMDPEVIDDLYLAGRDASDFQVEIADGRRVPFTLGPLESFDVHLLVDPQGHGSLNAKMSIEAKQFGQTVTFWSMIYARSVLADAGVLPNYLGIGVSGGSNYEQANVRIRKFLVENRGHIDITIRAADVIGGDADQFSVLTYDRALSYDRHQHYGQPFQGGRTVQPGDALELLLVYHPDEASVHRARVEVRHDAGTSVLELLGDCQASSSSGCRYAVPYAVATALP